MVICGQEFEFSLMNANDLDRFEDANERMQRRSAEESEQFRRGSIRLGDHARAQARIAMDCIDEILGAGSSDRLGLDEDKVVLTVAQHANTSAASIPLALDSAIKDGRIKRGDIVLLEAMGGGLTWGACAFRL